MNRRRSQCTALTIAGSDSGGGAGVQADLKTFAALGVHGTSAITCLTAQNPRRVSRVQAAHPGMVRAQIEAVLEALPPSAIKTGMLFSAPIIRAVVDCLAPAASTPVVVDPVMVATSGARLLQPNAVQALIRHLLPRAALITPNLDETSLLLGRTLRNVEDLRQAARDLHERFGCAALVKGGHLRGLKSAVDFFCDRRTELILEAPLIRRVNNHGTGCTYAAAITGYLAQGHSLSRAVTQAKHFVTQAIAGSTRVHGHDVLGFSPPA